MPDFSIHKTKYTIVLLLIGWSTVGLTSGNENRGLINDLKLGVHPHHGFVMPHHASLLYIMESDLAGAELSLSTRSYGKSRWDKLYRYPSYGLSYLYTTLGNNNILGTAQALFLFFDIPVFSNPKLIQLYYQVNWGLAYLNKKFDIDKNPYNLAISTHVNTYIGFDIYLALSFSKRSAINLGIDLAHFSNGKLDSPNWGINTFAFKGGYTFRFSDYRHEQIKYHDGDIINHKNDFEVCLNTGWSAYNNVVGKKYHALSLIADYKRNFSDKYQFGIGTDLFFDQSLKIVKKNEFNDNGHSALDLFQNGVHAGFYAKYGKINVVVHAGIYLIEQYRKYDLLYNRLGVRYDISPNLFANISIKAHYAIADYIEWGLGYRLPWSKNKNHVEN